MSTLKVTTIRSNSASTPPVIADSNGVETGQTCRAWVNFNGTGTVAIRDSFNVSSITDNGTGDYSVNFTVAMPSANYPVVAAADSLTGNAAYTRTIDGTTVRTTALFRIQTLTQAGATVDSAVVQVAVFGD